MLADRPVIVAQTDYLFNRVPDGVVYFGRGVNSSGLSVRETYEVHTVLLAIDCLG